MKKILYLAGSRADFGPVYNLLSKMNSSSSIQLKVLFCELNVLKKVESPWYTSVKQEFDYDEISVPLNGEQRQEIVDASIPILSAIKNTINQFSPDQLLILGDRFEQFLFSFAGFSLGIPIYHIHGGEISGSVDDYYRRAISNFSSIHFVSCVEAGDNIKRFLNISDETIYVTGAPGLETVKEFYCRSQHVEKEDICLISYHPDVKNINFINDDLRSITKAIKYKFKKIVWILGNSDPGSALVFDIVYALKKQIGSKLEIYEHLEREQYLMMMLKSKVFIGNSSSGIIESATIKIPFVNIGTRQNGRFQNDSTFNWKTGSKLNLTQVITLAINYNKSWDNIYYKEGSSSRILQHLIKSN
tara:strand:+ start:5289 stop:6365 length:1077 start_codon:yes stop_codon:yes gene_type:complete